MRTTTAILLAAAMTLPAPGAELSAQADESFELALFSPIQVRSPESSIRILRLSLLYGESVEVHGIDIGLVMRNTGGHTKGLQYGLVGLVDSDFTGWQDTAINVVDGRVVGVQSGLYNGTGSGEAFQFGLVNRAENLSGFQLGLVNLATNMYGLQIGLVNVIESKDRMAFLPIVNWSF